MAHTHLSDDACDRLVASRDPINAAQLREGTVPDLSRRLRDELLAQFADELSWPQSHGRSQRQRSRAGRRRVASIAATAVVVVVGMLAVVASLPGARGGHDGPLDVPAASAAVVLERAAQAAMRSVSVAPGQGQYGFVKVRIGSAVGGGIPTGLNHRPTWDAWLWTTQVKSDWYRADGSGRERTVRTSARFLTAHDQAIARAHGMTLAQLLAGSRRVFDGAFPPKTLLTAGVLPYWQISRLPTQPAALQRALERLLIASAPGRQPGPMMHQLRADPAQLFSPISQFLLLPTSAELRAALFRVLAQLPGVQLLGHQRDRLGRSGIAVAVTPRGGPARVREELLFDPATSNVLQTEMVQLRGAPGGPAVPAGTVLEYTDFLSRGVVSSITRLPDGLHLPLKPAGGSQ